MKDIIYQTVLGFLIVFVNLSLQCFTYLNWNWNLTAIIRFFIPLVLFRYCHPIFAMIILEGVLDSIEPSISRNNIEYHTRDKILDLWGWTISMIALWTIIKEPTLIKYRNILTILFVMRSIGNIMFIKTRNRKWLACCPNLYSMWFILLPVLSNIPFSKRYLIQFLLLFTTIKMMAEYIHHGSRVKERIKPFRKYTKWFCPGKSEMYQKTGTFPVDRIKDKMKAPLFIS